MIVLYDGLFVGCQGAFVTSFGENPKSEYRNPKQYRNTKYKTPLPLRDLILIPKQGRGNLKAQE